MSNHTAQECEPVSAIKFAADTDDDINIRMETYLSKQRKDVI
jgi:hypothetical protein